MRTDSRDESDAPIDLPLRQRERDVEPPLQETVRATETASASGGRRSFTLGMLVLGLLAGFGAGFVVGQRLSVPAPPRAVEIPRPAIPPGSGIRDPGSGIGDRGSGGSGSKVEHQLAEPVVPPPVITPLAVAPPSDPAPTATIEAPELKAGNPEPRTLKPEPRTLEPEPRTENPGSRIPDPGSRIPPSRPATIRFDSRPPGATIYLDEVRLGVTPMTLDTVTPGTHQVRMEMLGHETWRTSVTVKDGEQYFLGASLE